MWPRAIHPWRARCTSGHATPPPLPLRWSSRSGARLSGRASAFANDAASCQSRAHRRTPYASGMPSIESVSSVSCSIDEAKSHALPISIAEDSMRSRLSFETPRVAVRISFSVEPQRCSIRRLASGCTLPVKQYWSFGVRPLRSRSPS